FMWQLVLERMIKGLIVKNNQEVLPIHNLNQLAKRTDIEISPELSKQLKEISSFNLDARYEDYKEQFYQKANSSFSKYWIEIAERIYQWLLKKF
ncbi:MAG: HEPN domain-containing protein, partial [Candidatus Berkelbacteria bacterium Licking1014_85]